MGALVSGATQGPWAARLFECSEGGSKVHVFGGLRENILKNGQVRGGDVIYCAKVREGGILWDEGRIPFIQRTH